jgi:8-oxo-dGTP pyrophosphatase MutT (NUDIX family)
VPEDSNAGPALADVPEEWPVASSSYLHQDTWVVSLRADKIRRPDHPDDEPFRRLVLEHPGAAVVLAVDDDEQVLCVRQYRHAALRRFVELPAGLLDHSGEEPDEVARRELLEETGYVAASWTHLATTYSSPGISSEVLHIYLARGLEKAGPDALGEFVKEHEEADMELIKVGFDQLLAAVLDGRVADAPVLNAVLLAHAKGLAGSARTS